MSAPSSLIVIHQRFRTFLLLTAFYCTGNNLQHPDFRSGFGKVSGLCGWGADTREKLDLMLIPSHEIFQEFFAETGDNYFWKESGTPWNGVCSSDGWFVL